MPVAEDLHSAYRFYFTHGEVKSETSPRLRLRALLLSIYQAITVGIDDVLGLRRSKSRLSRMFLDDLRPGTLLDVGCGDGTFLNGMRGLGWDVEGVDFDGRAILNARRKFGLTLKHGDLLSAAFAESSFDAVTLSHVIEHVPDPIGLLKEVRRVLRPGGRAVLTTPNSGSFGHQVFRECWYGLDPPRHLHVFSPATLSETCLRAGLKPCQASSTAANADIFWGGSLSISEARSRQHRKLVGTDISLWRGCRSAFSRYREHFALRRYPLRGEEAFVVVTKSGETPSAGGRRNQEG